MNWRLLAGWRFSSKVPMPYMISQVMGAPIYKCGPSRLSSKLLKPANGPYAP